MAARFFYTFILVFAASAVSYCQNKQAFEKLPPSTQSSFKQIAGKYNSGPVDQRLIENDIKKSGLDLSQMSIEDAVMLLFNLIAQDARNDLSDMLKEMEATRKKRAAMREAEELMKKQMDSLRNHAQRVYDRRDSLATANAINEKQLNLQQYTIQEREIIVIENKAIEAKKSAEQHLLYAEEAIKKLRQLQSQKKQN